MISDALLARYTVAGPRYTSYPTAPQWQTSFGTDAYEQSLVGAGTRATEPLSLYVHLPFCKSLCHYCGCNVVISKDPSAADRYLDHVALELEMVAERLGARRTLSQIHWGGGTPTFLNEAQLERLWKEITRHFTPTAEAEVAIEIHPALTTNSQLATLRGLGFNRISMGLQDFDPEVQRATNRMQTYEETKALLEHARGLGFSGVNFDLIYGLPEQNAERWQKTLERVSSLKPDRLAIYSFAFVPEVLKHQRRMDSSKMPRGREKLSLFEAAWNHFTGLGYQTIGMDHFALPDDELARAQAERRLGRNFQGYTVKSASEVVAVGSTGISEVDGAYAQNVRALPYYYERINSGRFATERGLRTNDDDRRRRAVIDQLMCNFYVDLGDDGTTRYASELERLQPLIADGLAEVDGTRIAVTPTGRLFVRNLAMIFDAYHQRTERPRFSQTV